MWGYLFEHYMKQKISLFLFIISFSLNAQIVFNEIPSEKQLFGRDVETNYGLR